jgi:hypothetical protein
MCVGFCSVVFSSCLFFLVVLTRRCSVFLAKMLVFAISRAGWSCALPVSGL